MGAGHVCALVAALAAAGVLAAGTAASARLATGTYVGDGADSRAISGLPFAPVFVVVKGDLKQPAVGRTITMTGDVAKLLTQDNALLPNLIQGLTADGFVVGTHAAVNEAGTRYDWIAFPAEPGVLAGGVYEGDGVDDRNIEGLGFAPDFVLVIPERPKKAWWRSSAMAGDVSLPLSAAGEASNHIQTLTADGFQVGSDDAVNKENSDYHWLAVRADPFRLEVGSFLGDGRDDRAITGLAQPPGWVVLKSEAAKPAVHRTAAQGDADATLGFEDATSFPDGLQALLPDGFQVGTRAEVNEDGKAIYYAAFARTDLPADILVSKQADASEADVGDVITYAVTVTNLGPGPASGLVVADDLPASLAPVSSAASLGAYDPGTGLWSVGALAPGAQGLLVLGARVEAAAAGGSVGNTARVAALDQTDPESGNDSSTAFVHVPGADLRLAKSVDELAPGEGDTVTFTVTVVNDGPDDASSVVVSDALPAGLGYAGSAASQGAFVQSWEQWIVGELAAGASATLDLAAVVASGTAGLLLENHATIAAAAPADPDSDDNAADAAVAVAGTDLRLTKTVDVSAPAEDTIVTYTVTVANDGPQDVAGVAAADPLPARLQYVAHTATGGTSYTPATGAWTIGSLAAGASRVLTLQARVLPSTAGLVITNTAALTASSLVDPVPENDAAAVDVTVAGTNLALAMAADDPTPWVGQDVVLSLRLWNEGAGNAGGVSVQAAVPATVQLASATPSHGTYTPASGTWTVGNVAVGDTVGLDLTVRPLTGAVAAPPTISAAIAGCNEVDRDAADDSASVQLTVSAAADLELVKRVSPAVAAPGDTVRYRLVATNAGPNDASGVAVRDTLPAGLVPVSSAAGQGSYDGAAGLWTIGGLAAGDSAALDLAAVVAAGQAGADIVNLAAVVASDVADLVPGNETTWVRLHVPGADLSLEMTADPPAPPAGGTSTLQLVLGNAGPDPATHARVAVTWPAALAYVAAAADSGTFAAATGFWDVPSLASGGEATLALTLRAAAAAAGETTTVAAAIAGVTEGDPTPGGESASVALVIADGVIGTRAAARAAGAVQPGATVADLLRLRLANAAADPETLTTLALANLGAGAGGQADLDGEWQSLSLYVERDGTRAPARVASAGAEAAQRFNDGRLVFAGLAEPIAPGDTLWLAVEGQVALAARDGDRLAVGVAGGDDFAFAPFAAVAAEWPLTAGGALTVDGFVAAQVGLHAVAETALPLGAPRRLALDVTLPGNGYAADRLQRFNVVNLGNAAAQDLARLEAWTDDGDGAFSPAADARLGAFAFTGDRWELTGLAADVPPAGLRVFVTVDVAVGAAEGRTVRLALPGPPESAIGMLSANDGPLDAAVAEPRALVLTRTDHIVLSPVAQTGRAVAPGEAELPLLAFTAANPDSVVHRLVGLSATNASASANGGGQAQLDAAFTRLRLRLDGDADGALDGADVDSVLSETAFGSGSAIFAGLDVALAPGGVARFWVTGDVSLSAAADGDALAVVLAEAGDVTIAPATPVTAAVWPLDGGARWTVDGLVAAQLTAAAPRAAVLGPGDGPALALDLRVPANGYASDVLEAVTVDNLGTAAAADLSDVRLWRDGGDGAFGGDDVELAPLVPLGGAWRSPLLGAPIPAAGLRLFVGVTAAAAPTDSATVRLRLPVDGLAVASGNDGPRDAAVASPATLLLSTAPLLATLEIDPAASSLGQDVIMRMTVRNLGAEPLLGVAPVDVAVTGDDGLTPAGDPPAPVDLAAGADTTFVWTWQATAAGDVLAEGAAAGTGAGDGQPRRSLPVASNAHHVYEPATALDLFPVANRPFTVVRGQTGIVPLTLTMANPNGPAAAGLRVEGLRLRLEDEAGGGVAPAALLSRVVVQEGGNVYLDTSDLAAGGADLDLAFAQPALVTVNEPVTLGIRIDIAAQTTVPRFRLALTDGTGILARDAVNGALAAVRLGAGAYPVLSGLGRVTAEAVELDVAALPLADRGAGPGQEDVALLSLRLENPGLADLTNELRVEAFALALTDTLGVPLAAADLLQSLRVVAGAQVLLDRALDAADDTTLACALSAPAIVAPGEPLEMQVVGRIAGGAAPGAFRARLADASSWNARDRDTGESVPVVYDSPPLTGPRVCVQSPAVALLAAGVPRFPAQLTIGASDVLALSVVLRHPGAAGSAAIRGETLRLVCRDQARQRLRPATYLDRVAVLREGTVVAVAESPGEEDVLLSLGDWLLPAGGEIVLEVKADLEASAPQGTLELVLPVDGLGAYDANLGSPVALQAAPGAELPLASGLAALQRPADLLRARLESAMPVVLGAGAVETPVARLTLGNPAAAGAGGIEVEQVAVRAADRAFAALPAGAAVTRLAAYRDGEPWAACDTLDAADEAAVLRPAAATTVAPGQTLTLELRACFAAAPPPGGLRLGVTADDIGVRQPGGALFAIRVEPVAGSAFPLWTEAGEFSARGLAASYSNFPNPFAAGREATTFVYELAGEAAVTLRIRTVHGETVATLVDGAARAAGLHQEDCWDGRNGRGAAVLNGVYVAELTVRYAGGGEERLLRKVAVVR